MRRLMTAARWRDANGFYYGMSWRAVVALAVTYLAVRMF